MNRRALISGGLVFLLYGCGKLESSKKIATKKRVRSENLNVKIENPEDILSALPEVVEGFEVKGRIIDVDNIAVYVAKQGDHLSKVAERFYGTKSNWREVYALNKAARKALEQFNPDYSRYLIKSPHRIKVGQYILLEKAVEDLTLPEGRRF
ncbi:LysM peptidoglycan-binding domain-containing protein [Candidatus Woesearchaeota archaeon]|nr:LysM peptidoglycan-binding domain-containing protein [Candidatus Woesearchaeota archaeon]